MIEHAPRRSVVRAIAVTTFRCAGLALLAVTLAACKDSPTSPSERFNRTFTGNVPAFGVNNHAVTATRAGQIRGVLTWNNAIADLDLYLTDGACSTYPPGGGCTILASSDAVTGTSETVTRTVASGEQYKFWVDSFSLASIDYTLVVTIE